MSRRNMARALFIVMISIAGAGCTSLSDTERYLTQDLQLRDDSVVSPSLRLHKSIDDRTRLTLEVQALAGSDSRVLSLYSGRADLSPIYGSDPPEEFAYENILITGESMPADGGMVQALLDVSGRFRMRSIQAAYEKRLWQLENLSFTLGGIVKLNDFRLHARESRNVAASAQYRINETDMFFGVSTSLDWRLSDAITAGVFLAGLIDPFGDVDTQQAGITTEYRMSNVGLRYTLFRHTYRYRKERSLVSVTPSGQQLGVTLYY